MQFAHRYKLRKDIPGYKAGRTIQWSGSRNRFFFKAISEWKHDNGAEGIYADLQGPTFTVEQAQDRKWFKPVGALTDFIPAFPSRLALREFVDPLTPECKLVDDVDECRAINMLLDDSDFQERLYGFYKAQYEVFHRLEPASA